MKGGINMKWFEDVFLKSIFDRIGANNSKWLTVKQTSICCQYMEQELNRYENRYGDICNGLLYRTVWNGRKVLLHYSKLNGCGTITFDYTEQEKLQIQQRNEKIKQQRELEHIQRCYTKHPDKYAKKLKKIKADIVYWEEDLQECIADGADTTDTLRCLEESKQELELWESVQSI